MSLSRAKEEVRDGYLGDLPEELRVKLMNIHKLIVDTANAEFKKKKYAYLNIQPWAKTMLDEFLSQPADKSLVGSVRLYKKGKRCRCMIQITGHVNNNRNTEDEEFFHGFIRNVHTAVRAKVRRKFDMTLTCESEHGEHFEGFDVWTKQNVAKELWDLFADKKSKVIRPMEESTGSDILVAGIEELPPQLQELIESTNTRIYEEAMKISENNSIYEELVNHMAGFTENASDIGYTVLRRNQHGTFGSILITPSIDDGDIHLENTDGLNEFLESIWQKIYEEFNEDNPTKTFMVETRGSNKFFEMPLLSEYAEKLWEYLENTECETMEKKYPKNKNCHKKDEVVEESVVWDPFMESDNSTPEYNTDMSEAQAKKALRSLSQRIINDAKKKDYKVTQYTANIYANIITKNLLPLWAKGFRKFSITLDSYQSFHYFEFKIPTMTQDFVARFVEGRESINGLLHRTPEIRVKMSPRLFNNLENPDDAFNFFKAAIKYYDSGISAYSSKLMAEVMKMNREMKHLVSTSKLSGLVTCPMQMLFVFNDVKMSNKDTFKISQDDIRTVNQFVKGIYTKYAAPEKEKKQIIEDLTKVVSSLNESCNLSNIPRTIMQLTEAVQDLYDGKFNDEITRFKEQFIYENIDHEWSRNHPNSEIRYLQEKFGVKKLKKIPSDLIAYITIETEAIRDANDKMMIASYTISKLEIVEWYIELLDVGSKKYIVPHSKPYLESVRTQLLACYKKIMNTKVQNKQDRPLIDIKYPAGYEG